MPLTALDIKQAKPASKPHKLADGGGLYLLVNPNGSKWWRWDYRIAGKRKTLSMGTYPETTLAEAREKHAAARKLLAKGADPSADRQEAKRQWVTARQAADKHL